MSNYQLKPHFYKLRSHFHQLAQNKSKAMFTFIKIILKMKNSILSIIVISTLLFACKKNDIAKGTPKCIASEIASIKKNEFAQRPIVNEYIYQNETVFLIDDGMGYVDSQSKVVDSHCNELGYLGGMMGQTKINGEDFFAAAVYVKTIWKK